MWFLSQSRRGRGAAVPLLVLLLLSASLVPLPQVAAEATVVMDARLPTARDGTAAVWVDGHAYVFGGDDGARKRQILRYDPTSDTLATMGAELPSARSGMSAVWTGTYVYLFGGWNGSPYSKQVLRYDPALDTLTVMGAELPTGRYYTSAVWNGTHAFVFGGGVQCSPCTTDEILRYDPLLDTVEVMDATLPVRRYGTSAVFDGTYAYVFGGVTASTSTEHDEIVRYHPATDSASLLEATLPTGRYHTSAALIAGKAYVFGGYPCAGWPYYCDEILEFEPGNGTITVHNTTLSTGRYLTSAAASATHAYLFGGFDGAKKDQVLRFGPYIPPPPPPPPNTPPSVDAVLDQTVLAGQWLNLSFHADDPDGDALALYLEPTPGNATFTDHGDGTASLAWLTTQDDAGDHPFTVRAHDGEDNGTASFTVTVTGNPPPTINAIPDTMIAENQRLQQIVVASDPEGEPITLSVNPLPAGATFVDHGDGTGLFDWRPGYDQAGVHRPVITAHDGTSGAQRSFKITVTNVDRAPSIDPAAPPLFIIGEPGSFTVQAQDPDNDPIAVTASSVPSGATVTDHGDGTATFQWTPAPGANGTYSVTFTATAGGKSASTTATVHVVPEVDFRLSPVGSSFIKASPGDILRLPFLLRNTGAANDTIMFSATNIIGGHSWVLTTPPATQIAGGDTLALEFVVQVPETGTLAKPRIHATSTVKPSLQRMLTWIVEVPVVLSVELDVPHRTLVDLTALEPVSGTVTATWWSGAPAQGVALQIVQNVKGAADLSSTVNAVTNHTGQVWFSFGMEPLSRLPGEHDLFVHAHRHGRVDTIQTVYSIGVV